MVDPVLAKRLLRTTLGFLGAALLVFGHLYPQGVALDTAARKTAIVITDSTRADWGRSYLQGDTTISDSTFHKLQSHQDTAKAIPDTTSGKHADSKRLIGGIVLVSFVIVYVVLWVGLNGFGNAMR